MRACRERARDGLRVYVSLIDERQPVLLENAPDLVDARARRDLDLFVRRVDAPHTAELGERKQQAGGSDDRREGMAGADDADGQIARSGLAHDLAQVVFALRRGPELRHAILVADPVAPKAALFPSHIRFRPSGPC